MSCAAAIFGKRSHLAHNEKGAPRIIMLVLKRKL